ncbi:MAG: hypothetical protein CMC82_00425 [Flavobacteriaceae bacterium]|nr:hypothetical protein [Flavobacteriaceae bacterium]|tara:strand:- start:1506 stop:2345 length:840 start_codon:yes stop_codon:yes gene_type:complete
MLFFNKKEEVIDVQLTQFGKNLLSRGAFKPEYYRFFDDDILYNSSRAGLEEHQNNTESRIIENTPKLKTQYNTFGVEKTFYIEKQQIQEGLRQRLVPIDIEADPFIQERILLYPLDTQEAENQDIARLSLSLLDQEMETSVSFLSLTGSGIRKNIPQLTVEPKYILKEDRENITEPGMVNLESFFDLTSREIIFADNSKIMLESKNLIINLEEFNVSNGVENFELEIYEIVKRQDKDVIVRIEDLNEVNKYFSIKTDEDVAETDYKNQRKNNYYKEFEE